MFQELIPKLLSHQNIAVFSHVRPDGDCIGSQVALSLWLQKNGVKVSAFNEDTIAENLTWLTHYFPVTTPRNLDQFDAFVVVDGNALHRFGEAAETLKDLDKPIYMIDHHPDPEDIFEEFISREESSSTCELVFQLYEQHDLSQIDTPAAKAMFTGMVTDTASFQFDSVSPQTLRAASVLLEQGKFAPNEISERIYSNRPLRQLKLLSLTLNTLTLHADGAFATIAITQKMLEDTGCTKEDTEGFVKYPLSVKGVKACVLFREDDDRVKLSLRSKSHIDVNKWARKFNGGGHKRAAGAWHPGPMEEAVKEVIKEGAKYL